MLLLRLLRRKDAYSVVIAIVVGLALALMVSTIAMTINGVLEQLLDRSRVGALTFNWRSGVLNPLVAFALQIAVLESVLQVALHLRKLTRKAFNYSK